MKVNKKRRHEEGKSKTAGSLPLPPSKRVSHSRRSGQNTTLGQSEGAQKAHPLAPPICEEDPNIESRPTSNLRGSLSMYEVTDMNVITSSQIQAKVTRIVKTLDSFSFVAPTKPSVVLVHARGGASSKLISIVEIAKREISRAGGKWYQYNSLEQAIVTQEVKQATTNTESQNLGQRLDADADEMEVDESGDIVQEEESMFEIMKTPLERAIEGRPKIQAVPLLTIYLSRIRIDYLKRTYGFVKLIIGL